MCSRATRVTNPTRCMRCSCLVGPYPGPSVRIVPRAGHDGTLLVGLLVEHPVEDLGQLLGTLADDVGAGTVDREALRAGDALDQQVGRGDRHLVAGAQG